MNQFARGNAGEAAELDHLVYACPNLEHGIGLVEELLATRLLAGGAHPGLGTRNALLGFGPGSYLEVIGPDPEQRDPPRPRPFGIDGLDRPRLVTWAVRPPRRVGIEEYCREARERGMDLGVPRAMSRETPGGERLEWRLALPPQPLYEALVPFVIEWGDTPHPSVSLSHQVRLAALRASHPEAEALGGALRELAIDRLAVRQGKPQLEALIRRQDGEEVWLR